MGRSMLARSGTNLTDPDWSAFLARDRSARGRFVVGVVTTGIYCAPDCPARAARRENLRRFDTWGEAEGAGFRACLRCDPKQARRTDVPAEAVRIAILAIEAGETAPPLAELAKRTGYSSFHFQRMFRSHTGLTPAAYARAVKARRLRDALAEGQGVLDASLAAGYGAVSRAYVAAGTGLGMAPGRARRGGLGERIRAAQAISPFGPVLVGATVQGICFIGFGEAPDRLRSDLERRFPHACVEDDNGTLRDWVAAVIATLHEPGRALLLPLDLRGTAFQMRVWQALSAIPPGATKTYSELAASIGAPRAVRAVGSACGANPVAPLVPCHRAVGAAGRLRGYRWGLPVKQALLDAERRPALGSELPEDG